MASRQATPDVLLLGLVTAVAAARLVAADWDAEALALVCLALFSCVAQLKCASRRVAAPLFWVAPDHCEVMLGILVWPLAAAAELAATPWEPGADPAGAPPAAQQAAARFWVLLMAALVLAVFSVADRLTVTAMRPQVAATECAAIGACAAGGLIRCAHLGSVGVPIGLGQCICGALAAFAVVALAQGWAAGRQCVEGLDSRIAAGGAALLATEIMCMPLRGESPAVTARVVVWWCAACAAAAPAAYQGALLVVQGIQDPDGMLGLSPEELDRLCAQNPMYASYRKSQLEESKERQLTPSGRRWLFGVVMVLGSGLCYAVAYALLRRDVLSWAAEQASVAGTGPALAMAVLAALGTVLGGNRRVLRLAGPLAAFALLVASPHFGAAVLGMAQAAACTLESLRLAGGPFGLLDAVRRRLATSPRDAGAAKSPLYLLACMGLPAWLALAGLPAGHSAQRAALAASGPVIALYDTFSAMLGERWGRMPWERALALGRTVRAPCCAPGAATARKTVQGTLLGVAASLLAAGAAAGAVTLAAARGGGSVPALRGGEPLTAPGAAELMGVGAEWAAALALPVCAAAAMESVVDSADDLVMPLYAHAVTHAALAFAAG